MLECLAARTDLLQAMGFSPLGRITPVPLKCLTGTRRPGQARFESLCAALFARLGGFQHVHFDT